VREISWLLIVVGTAFLLLVGQLSAHAAPRLDIVIDIDHVLVDNIAGVLMTGVPESKTITVLGEKYRVADGVAEFLESLSRIPGARISFFSNAPAERNLDLLGKIKLKDGRTALDLAEGRVLSRPDITKLEYLDEEEYGKKFWRSFSGTTKKDLTKVPGLDLEHAILIEDQKAHALPGQERNLLNVYDPGIDIVGRPESHDDQIKSLATVDPESAREIGEARVSDRNRLAYARGLIDQALEKAAKEGLTPVEALSKLQWQLRDGVVYFKPMKTNVDAFRRGAVAFRQVNRQYHFTPALTEQLHGCQDALWALLRKLTPRSE
jgi:hypothetical protein